MPKMSLVHTFEVIGLPGCELKNVETSSEGCQHSVNFMGCTVKEAIHILYLAHCPDLINGDTWLSVSQVHCTPVFPI